MPAEQTASEEQAAGGRAGRSGRQLHRPRKKFSQAADSCGQEQAVVVTETAEPGTVVKCCRLTSASQSMEDPELSDTTD